MITSAAEYHAHLVALADEQAAKLADKVDKLEAQLADAREAHAAAQAEAARIRKNPPDWVESTEFVTTARA